MLFIGSDRVSEAAAVWQWKRRRIDSGFRAPYRFLDDLRPTGGRRGTSPPPRKVLLRGEKNVNRGANSSTCSPALVTSSRYAMALQNVKASSCSELAPASLMW